MWLFAIIFAMQALGLKCALIYLEIPAICLLNFLPYLFTSRIGHFQAGGHRNKPNLALVAVCFVMDACCFCCVSFHVLSQEIGW